MFKSQKSIMAAAMASVAMMGSRVFGASNIAYVTTQNRKGAKRLINRSRYSPHQGEREIARRQLQAGRNVARQFNRAVEAGHPTGTLVSRRGRVIAQTA